MPKVGLLVGRERSFPNALIEEVNRRKKSVQAEYIQIGAPRMAETPSGMLNSIGLQGPGIDGVAAYAATDAACAALEARDAQHYQYPQGIDMLLVTEGGALTALPRLTMREVR